MKITIEVGQDAELRKQILEIVATQVKKIAGEEIKELVTTHLQQINIAAKVSSALKDLVNRQINFAIQGYGSMMVQQLLNNHLENWSDGKEKIEGHIKKAVGKLVNETVNVKFIDTLKDVINNKTKE